MDPRPSTPLLAAAPADRTGSGEPAPSGFITGSPSGSDESADQVDHAVDIGIGQSREQRQRDLLGVVVLGDRAHTPLIAEISVDGVPVDGHVVDLDTDVVRPEVLEQPAAAAIAYPQRVEVPHRVRARAALGQAQLVDAGKSLVVAGRDRLPASLESGKSQQLAGAESAQHVRQAVVEPELVDLLVPGALVGVAEHGGIAGQPDAAIAPGSFDRLVQQAYDRAPLSGGEVLGGEEGEGGQV